MDLSRIKVKTPAKCPKRKGRGVGSTLGKTAGRGNKGAGQRAGKKLPYLGFCGGNLPYFRKIPKRGFNSPTKKEYQIVNLRRLQTKLAAEKDVSQIGPDLLKKLNLIKDKIRPIKILGRVASEPSLKATFKADKFSASAVKIIEGWGGTAERRQNPVIASPKGAAIS